MPETKTKVVTMAEKATMEANAIRPRWAVMMRLLAGALLTALVLSGCTDKDRTPSGIIPPDQMGSILWDMVQADQYATSYLLKDSAKTDVKLERLKLFQQVYQLHHITHEDFSKSFSYYLGRPDLTRPMFDSLLAKGNRQRQDSYKNPSAVITPPASPAVIAPTATPVLPGAKPAVNTPGVNMPGVNSPGAHTPGIVPNRPANFPGRPGAEMNRFTDSVRRAHHLPFRPATGKQAADTLHKPSGGPKPAANVQHGNSN